jgi:hypothetical protein
MKMRGGSGQNLYKENALARNIDCVELKFTMSGFEI